MCKLTASSQRYGVIDSLGGKPIKVWKVVRVVKGGFTPVCFTIDGLRVPFGEAHVYNRDPVSFPWNGNGFDKGYGILSFMTRKDAREWKNKMKQNFDYQLPAYIRRINLRVIKAEIPVGSAYYRGRGNDNSCWGVKMYRSEKLDSKGQTK